MWWMLLGTALAAPNPLAGALDGALDDETHFEPSPTWFRAADGRWWGATPVGSDDSGLIAVSITAPHPGRRLEAERDRGPGRDPLAPPSFFARIGSEVILGLGRPVDPAPLGIEPLERLAPGLFRTRASDPAERALELAARLSLVPGVYSAEPDLWLEVEPRDFAVPPDDPRYPGQWYLGRVDIEAAWRLHPGDPSTVVAIVDNGCDLEHEDLAFDGPPGYDAVDDDDDPSHPESDDNNHGTACAGVVAARGNNGRGIAGACPQCTLQCVRLLPPRGSPGLPTSAAVRAFEHIRTTSVAVASNSWGYVGDIPVPAPVRAALERLMAEGRGGRGTTVVFAAGNSRSEIPSHAIAAVPGVLTVSATNLFDELVSFSSFGPAVDLAAPGGTVTTDISGPRGSDPGDYTSSFGGTSAACPLVAGVAALLASADPAATPSDIRAALVESARPAPFARPDERGHDQDYGYGLVNPAGALLRLRPDLAPETPEPPEPEDPQGPRGPPERPEAPDSTALDGEGGCRHTGASGSGLGLAAAWWLSRRRHRPRQL